MQRNLELAQFTPLLGILILSTGYEFHTMETDFSMGDSPEELIEEFVDAAEAIVDITSAQDVINNVFD